MNKDDVLVGDKLIVIAGAIYRGEVTEIEEGGFWITENKETEEFIAFDDVEDITFIKR